MVCPSHFRFASIASLGSTETHWRRKCRLRTICVRTWEREFRRLKANRGAGGKILSGYEAQMFLLQLLFRAEPIPKLGRGGATILMPQPVGALRYLRQRRLPPP